MFEKYIAIIFGAPKLSNSKVDNVVKNPTLMDCEIELINKFLSAEELNIISNTVEKCISNKVIPYNGNDYKVAVRYDFTRYHYDLPYIEIFNTDGSKSTLNEYHKCKFIVDNMEEVKESLKDISNIVSKRIEDAKSKERCREECIKTLHSIIKKMDDV